MSSSPSPPPPAAPTTAILAVAAQPPYQTPSSTTTLDPLAPPPPRKFPAPCWTHDETLALIGSYQDKWYSLRRRNLRTADWDAVAEEVARRCPTAAPPAKTSAQCRHKMEKLRKRYRTEKQRISSLPVNHGNSRFFGSSWVFFDLMDHMELGSGGSLLSNNNAAAAVAATAGHVDLEVKPYSMNDNHQSHGNSGNNEKKGDLGKYFDEIMLGGGKNQNQNQNHSFDVRSAGLSPAPHIKIKVKNQQYSRPEYGVGVGDGGNEYEEGEEYIGGMRGRDMMSSPPVGFKRKSMGGGEEMYGSRLNGCAARKEKESSSGGSRGRGKESVVGEMVESIKMLGEGLVKMEKMKMEMMRDIEKMRMEMEMKRSEMILESQHLIVNAFIDGLKKNKKVKVVEIE